MSDCPLTEVERTVLAVLARTRVLAEVSNNIAELLELAKALDILADIALGLADRSDNQEECDPFED